MGTVVALKRRLHRPESALNQAESFATLLATWHGWPKAETCHDKVSMTPTPAAAIVTAGSTLCTALPWKNRAFPAALDRDTPPPGNTLETEPQDPANGDPFGPRHSVTSCTSALTLRRLGALWNC